MKNENSNIDGSDKGIGVSFNNNELPKIRNRFSADYFVTLLNDKFLRLTIVFE